MQKKDIGLGAVSVAFGAWLFYMATALKSGAAFWPKIVASVIIILGLIIVGTALVPHTKNSEGGSSKTEKAPPQYLKVLEIIVLMMAYYMAFQQVGYTIPTFCLIVGTAFILGYRNWKVMIPTALIISVCLYLAFTKLFGVHFPGVFF